MTNERDTRNRGRFERARQRPWAGNSHPRSSLTLGALLLGQTLLVCPLSIGQEPVNRAMRQFHAEPVATIMLRGFDAARYARFRHEVAQATGLERLAGPPPDKQPTARRHSGYLLLLSRTQPAVTEYLAFQEVNEHYTWEQHLEAAAAAVRQRSFSSQLEATERVATLIISTSTPRARVVDGRVASDSTSQERNRRYFARHGEFVVDGGFPEVLTLTVAPGLLNRTRSHDLVVECDPARIPANLTRPFLAQATAIANVAGQPRDDEDPPIAALRAAMAGFLRDTLVSAVDNTTRIAAHVKLPEATRPGEPTPLSCHAEARVKPGTPLAMLLDRISTSRHWLRPVETAPASLHIAMRLPDELHESLMALVAQRTLRFTDSARRAIREAAGSLIRHLEFQLTLRRSERDATICFVLPCNATDGLLLALAECLDHATVPWDFDITAGSTTCLRVRHPVTPQRDIGYLAVHGGFVLGILGENRGLLDTLTAELDQLTAPARTRAPLINLRMDVQGLLAWEAEDTRLAGVQLALDRVVELGLRHSPAVPVVSPRPTTATADIAPRIRRLTAEASTLQLHADRSGIQLRAEVQPDAVYFVAAKLLQLMHQIAADRQTGAR